MQAVMAHLEEAEVAALRIYTTAAYKSLSALLDTAGVARGERHPLALTVYHMRARTLSRQEPCCGVDGIYIEPGARAEATIRSSIDVTTLA